MSDPLPLVEGVPVALAAVRLGISVDGVHKRIKRGQLEAQKVRGEWRVFLPEPVIDVGPPTDEPTHADLSPTVPDSPTRSLMYQQLVEPFRAQIREMQTTIQQQAQEIGDLKRQVRDLTRRLNGMREALDDHYERKLGRKTGGEPA